MTVISAEYGGGLFALACDAGLEKEILDDTVMLREILADDWIHILINPGIPKNERIGLVREVLDGRVHEYVVNFVMLMTERGRADGIGDSFAEYEKLYLGKFSVVKARAESAYPLTDGQKDKLKEKLCHLSGMSVEIEYVINPELIGGMRVTWGENSIDDSLRCRLKKLGEVITASPYKIKRR